MVRVIVFSVVMVLATACGKTSFSGGENALLKSDVTAAEDTAVSQPGDAEGHLLQEAEDNPGIIKDYSCGRKKVYICHNGQTLCVSESALPAHMDHEEDMLGSCDTGPNKKRCQKR